MLAFGFFLAHEIVACCGMSLRVFLIPRQYVFSFWVCMLHVFVFMPICVNVLLDFSFTHGFSARALFLEFDWHWIGIVFLDLALMFWFTITISLVYFLLELIAPIVFVDFYKTWIRQSKINNANPDASQQKNEKSSFYEINFNFGAFQNNKRIKQESKLMKSNPMNTFFIRFHQFWFLLCFLFWFSPFFGGDASSIFWRNFSSDIFFLEICLRIFWQTVFFKDSLVEVSSEICLVGISLQRMVKISLQRLPKVFVGDNSFPFFW